MPQKVRVRYLIPTAEIRGRGLYVALSSAAASVVGGAVEEFEVHFRAPHQRVTLVKSLRDSDEPLTPFVLSGKLPIEYGTIDLWLSYKQQRLTLRIGCEDDDIAKKFRDELVEKLLLAPEAAIGLSLSGGGFRATLFHLGVIRFLRDAGQLKKVTHIFAVSGGSIIAAHVAVNWSRYVGSDSDFNSAAKELIDFTRRDLRGRILRRWLLFGLLFGWIPIIRRRFTRISLLQREYRSLLRRTVVSRFKRTRPAELRDLEAAPSADNTVEDTPDVFLLATAMKRGDLCAFTRQGFSYESEPERQFFEADYLQLSSAVAASSAFPPLFPPLSTKRLGLIGNELMDQAEDYLSDGGVFDNLGTRKFLWMRQQVNHELKYFVISDASSPLDWSAGRIQNVWSRNIRATNILMRRVGDLEYESATRRDADFDTQLVRCHVEKKVDDDVSEPSAVDQGVQKLIGKIRTDLNGFSKTEIRSLVWHGYVVARNAFDDALPASEREDVSNKTAVLWDPFSGEPKEEPDAVRHSLRKSHAVSLGVRSALTDWVTYATALTVVAVVGVGNWLVNLGVGNIQTTAVATMAAERKTVEDQGSSAFDQMVAGVTNTLEKPQLFDFAIKYRTRDQILGSVNADLANFPPPPAAGAPIDPASDPRLERLLKIAGKQSPPARAMVEISKTDDGKERWLGTVSMFRFPSFDAQGPGPTTSLMFFGEQEKQGVLLKFAQSYAKAEQSAEAYRPAPNRFEVAIQREGNVYRGVLNHPQITSLQIGEVEFTPVDGP